MQLVARRRLCEPTYPSVTAVVVGADSDADGRSASGGERSYATERGAWARWFSRAAVDGCVWFVVARVGDEPVVKPCCHSDSVLMCVCVRGGGFRYELPLA
jgi:hypothetical protein